jgi:heme/copper-type cytochrome/quinol oxidase subunit 2
LETTTTTVVAVPVTANKSDESINAALIGGIIGGVALIAIIVALFAWFVVRARRRNANVNDNGTSNQQQEHQPQHQQTKANQYDRIDQHIYDDVTDVLQ